MTIRNGRDIRDPSAGVASTAVGPESATLTINSNDPANPNLLVSLTGSGIVNTTTAISAPAITYGQNGAVTVTLTSTPTGFTVAGTVTLSVDGGAVVSQPLVGGSATFDSTNTPALVAPTVLNPGHSLTATYAAQAGFQASSATGTLLVNPAALTITASSGAMTYGGPVPAITPGFSGFVLGQTNLTGLTVQPTCLTTATSASSVGSYPSTCSGAAGSNYLIGYVGGAVAVGQATSATTITSNLPNPAIVGQIVTVRFTVTPQFAGSLFTGTVTVNASTRESCTATLPALSCNLIFATGGARTLTATYSGDVNVTGSTSAPVNQGVAGVSLSTTALLFGDQLVGTNSARQTITLSNVGTTVIAITSIVSTNNADYNFTTTCGTTLGVGRSCNINVRFHPTLAGVRSGTITITDSDPTPQVVSLTGTGVAPINSVSPLSIPFGGQTRGTTSAPQTVTVANTGTAPLVINRINLAGANPNQFSQNNNCPATLAIGANCTVSVTFRPTNRGAKTATLNVNVAAPAANASVTLSGTGQ